MQYMNVRLTERGERESGKVKEIDLYKEKGAR